MMTREEVLTEMEASFETMPEELKTSVLFNYADQDWTPTSLLEAVRSGSEMGLKYADSWAQNKADQQALLDMLDALLGPPGPNDMTCGDPDCPNCHGEVRPFDQKG